MKKNGFTLIELLAVIVVLAIIMTIAGTSVLGQKKKANQEEVKSIYNDIKAFGPDVYLEEKDNLKNKVYFDIEYLKTNGYLKSSVKSPIGSGYCKVYLLIDKTNDENIFDAYVNCEGLDPYGTNPTDNGYTYFKKVEE